MAAYAPQVNETESEKNLRSACRSFFNSPFHSGKAPRTGNQDVKPRISQPLSRAGSKENGAFERIASIAQGLQRLPDVDAAQLAEFFEAAQGFLQALAIGHRHGQQGIPLLFGLGR